MDEPTPEENEPSSAASLDRSPGGEQPSSESPTPGKRSNEFWLALASIVAALLVGVIAVGSGWYAAVQRDKQETIRQKLSSTASQQKEAYVGFINSAGDVAVALQLQVRAIKNRYPYFLYSPIPDGKSDVEAKFTDLGHALDLAQLYGSARVRELSNKVFDAAAQSRVVVVGWNLTHPGHDPNSVPCPELLEFEKKTESDRQQLGNAIDDFNDAAREDLGIPALPRTSTPPEPLLAPDTCATFPR